MRIGELARRGGVGIDTVRFYERAGLLAAPARSPSGYRDYAPASVERLLFARQLQRLGFKLHEIAELMDDVDRGAATCAAEQKRFEAVLARVDEKLSELRAVRRRLATTLRRCATGECQLLEVTSRARR